MLGGRFAQRDLSLCSRCSAPSSRWTKTTPRRWRGHRAALHPDPRRPLHPPVVIDGGQCPKNLDCESCDKLVLTGADLLYWRRKREHWYSIAERAPGDATADWLHQLFAPTARAIDGLEKALAMDLRRPQDYFGRIWSTGFVVDDLVADDDIDEETEVA